MPVEVYDKTTPMVGRRLRKIASSATAGMKKIASNLYSSRGADVGVPVFSGPNIANIALSNGNAANVATAGKWTNVVGTPVYSKSAAGTAWPAWLNINPSTGQITGTAVTGTTNGLKV